MGFSDSLKKFAGQIAGAGLGGIPGKIGAQAGFGERGQKGQTNKSDFLSALGLGGFTQRQISERSNFNIGNVLKADLDAVKGSAFGANVAHQLLFKEEAGTDAPPVRGAPAQNEQVLSAKRQARQRAINAASQRRGLGLSGTIATSPLGLQGDGAATSSRKLIGE